MISFHSRAQFCHLFLPRRLLSIFLIGKCWFVNSELSHGENGDCNDKRAGNVANQPVLGSQASGQFDKCCGEDGICSHEVLRDGETGSPSNLVHNKFMRKVLSSSFPEHMGFARYIEVIVN